MVLKADAYGHGLVPMAKAATRAGADVLGVCTNLEARSIREVGIETRIMRLRAALPGEYEQALELGVEEVLAGVEEAEFLNRLGRRRAGGVRAQSSAVSW